MNPLHVLNKTIITCRQCPRLVEFRESVQPKKPFLNDTYWHKPVPGFGDTNAWLLIVGLAPAAHGGNRTGRILTGDKTSDFLFRALYDTNFSNHPYSRDIHDGLILTGIYLTASVKCVPPKDKPTRDEILTCNHYLKNEIKLLPNIKAVLCLGKLAFDAYLVATQGRVNGLKFEHGKKYILPNSPMLYATYHPSPRNTQTGRLTPSMLHNLLKMIREEQNL